MVDAGKESQVEQAYAYVDIQPAQGHNEYRIKQTSLDGGTSYSQVETVELGGRRSFHLSPNPAHNYVDIEMADMEHTIVTLRNQLGQLVEVARELQSDKMTLHTADLPKGVYFVEIRTAKEVFIEKLMVE